MESIKNKVSSVLGSKGTTDDTTGTNTGSHTGTTGYDEGSTTGTTGTTGYSEGSTTGTTGTTGYSEGSTTGTSGTTGYGVGSTTGNTGTTDTRNYDQGSTTTNTEPTGGAPTVHDQITSDNNLTTSSGERGYGRDDTTTTGASDTIGTSSGFSGATGSTSDTKTGTSGITHGVLNTSDITGVDNDSRRDDIPVPTKDDSSTSHHHHGDDSSTSHHHHGDDSSTSHHHHDPHEIQSPEQGPDPSLVGDPKEHPKLTGQGAPGSHSAVFGLTPDGKKYDDASHGTTPVRPAHSEETSMGKKSIAGAAGADSGGDTVSGGHGGVSNQIDAPDTGKKGLERTDPVPMSGGSSGDKPGAGATGLD